jgi:SAM-dependent methyltransferase
MRPDPVSAENPVASRREWQQRYLEKYYFGRPGSVHPAVEWENFVRSHTPERGRVLEIGGGPEDWTTRVLRERAGEIVGLDIDDVIRTNRYLDQAVVYDGNRMPPLNGRFDLAISRWVVEHIENPALHFEEVHRVLSPGGVYIFRTVNLFHYMASVSRITPHRLQIPLARWLRHVPSDGHDPYPTVYRANTRHRIRSLAEAAGFRPVMIRMHEPFPAYGMGSRLMFYVLMGYERLVNSSDKLEGLRHMIDCVLKKDGGETLDSTTERKVRP